MGQNLLFLLSGWLLSGGKKGVWTHPASKLKNQEALSKWSEVLKQAGFDRSADCEFPTAE